MNPFDPPLVGDASRPSLRDRRRSENLQIIHESAMALTMQQGPGRTTIEQIASTAGVSVRTVFVYYNTKEDAILGLVPPFVSEEAVNWFINHDVKRLLIERTIGLLTSILRSMNIPNMDIGRRRTLVEAHPELLQRLQTRVSEASELLTQVLALLPDGPTFPVIDRHSLRLAATAVVQRAFLTTSYARFPTGKDLEEALQTCRRTLCV